MCAIDLFNFNQCLHGLHGIFITITKNIITKSVEENVVDGHHGAHSGQHIFPSSSGVPQFGSDQSTLLNNVGILTLKLHGQDADGQKCYYSLFTIVLSHPPQ